MELQLVSPHPGLAGFANATHCYPLPDGLEHGTPVFVLSAEVGSHYATVQDALDDATIHLRKAAQSASAAEEQMKAVDVMRRRAKGDLSKFIKDLVDIVTPVPEPEPVG